MRLGFCLDGPHFAKAPPGNLDVEPFVSRAPGDMTAVADIEGAPVEDIHLLGQRHAREIVVNNLLSHGPLQLLRKDNLQD
jgi:hypothetical protein